MNNKNIMEYKKGDVWLNVGCGVSLANLPFTNVDNFFTLEDLKKGKGKKGSPYKNARIPKGVKFVKADMCALPFEDNCVDYIECNDAIEHLGIFQVETALREFYRVLKSGGKLGMSTTNFDEIARLWTLNVTGSLFKTQEDMNRYVMLAKITYGNQAGPGEYHKVPFNPAAIAYFLNTAGFKLDNITIHIFPTNSLDRMPQLAYKHHEKKLKNMIILSEMMWVEAIK